jgi:hypothetical protein
MNELTIYEEMKFKKRLFGGYDRLDVLNKMNELNKKYQGLMKSQQDYYESIIKDIKEGKDISLPISNQRNVAINPEGALNNYNNINEEEIEKLLQTQKNFLVAMILEMQQHYDEKMDNYQENIEENVNYILRLVDRKVDELKTNGNTIEN